MSQWWSYQQLQETAVEEEQESIHSETTWQQIKQWEPCEETESCMIYL